MHLGHETYARTSDVSSKISSAHCSRPKPNDFPENLVSLLTPSTYRCLIRLACSSTITNGGRPALSKFPHMLLGWLKLAAPGVIGVIATVVEREKSASEFMERWDTVGRGGVVVQRREVKVVKIIGKGEIWVEVQTVNTFT